MNTPISQTITLPLPLFLDLVLGDSDSQPIDWKTAEVLLHLTKNQHTCFVQSVDHEGEKLAVPRLWRLEAWRQDATSRIHAKARADRERLQRWLLDENVKRLARAIEKFSGISADYARVAAHKKLTRRESLTFFIQNYGLRLATSEKDL